LGPEEASVETHVVVRGCEGACEEAEEVEEVEEVEGVVMVVMTVEKVTTTSEDDGTMEKRSERSMSLSQLSRSSPMRRRSCAPIGPW
jgi:hypothetical protein